jgi:predicted ribonuclease YlaK
VSKYVLDSSALMEAPSFIKSLQGSLAIPSWVYEELDRNKSKDELQEVRRGKLLIF